MHILLIHQAFVTLDEPGGTRHHELARYLAACGHRVTVIASPISYLTGKQEAPNPSQKKDELEDGITVLRAYTYKALHRSFIHRIFSFFSFMASSFVAGLRVRDIDLVWGTSPPIFQGVTAWALARLKRIPFLFEVRDLWPAFAIAVGVLRNQWLISASMWLEKFLYNHADHIVVNSPGFLKHVKERGARLVSLIPNGADTDMFDPYASGAAFRKAHNLEGKYVALYAGAHGMSNDLGTLLQAAKSLEDKPEIAIVLVGDGKDKPDLLAQAQSMALSNVLFTPPVPKSEMREALAAADACIAILKSIPMYDTVYPNKVFDYMAAARPVVLAISGVIRDVVEENGAGIYAPPGDAQAIAQAIRQLADNPETGREMGQRGRKCVEEQFDRQYLATVLTNLMESMVS